MSEVISADTISIEGCEADCPCQLVHVVMWHEDKTAFAAITLSPRDARRLAADLLSAADEAEARKLQLEGRLS